MSHIVIGTAGHIDHGKTALVKALTGTDTDRLPEEKSRGVTIDIGFAFLGDNITIIDVPGHERFIKNMVTGISSISYVILVIAADDGVMPQTREHLDILDILGVKDGCVVLNKTDLVKPDWLELVEADVKKLLRGTFLENAMILKASSVNGNGIEDIKKHLKDIISNKRDNIDRGYFRLPVDRAFSVKGFGTVVTGTVISGSVKKGDLLDALPGGLEVKVRGIQKHNRDAESAEIGERAALNLSGVNLTEVGRGHHLSEKGYLRSTSLLEANIELLKNAPKKLSNRTRVRLHLGTGEVMGRLSIFGGKDIEPGESGLVQIFLEKESAVAVADKFIMRRYSPSLTIGGGKVLQISNKRYKRNDEHIQNILSQLNEGDELKSAELIARECRQSGINAKELGIKLGVSSTLGLSLLKDLSKSGKLVVLKNESKERYYSPEMLDDLKDRLSEQIDSLFKKNPLSGGIKSVEIKEQLALPNKVFEHIVGQLISENKIAKSGDLISRVGNGDEKSDKETEELEKVLMSRSYNAFTTEELSEKIDRDKKETFQLVKRLVSNGKAIRLDGDFFLHTDLLENLKEKVDKHFEDNDELTVSDLKQLADVSRKFAIPLLLWLDDNEVTRRDGNIRIKA